MTSQPDLFSLPSIAINAPDVSPDSAPQAAENGTNLAATCEQFRLECEAREWLRRCDWDTVRIRAKLVAIAARRGQAGADRLAAQMRIEWAKGKA